MQTWHANEFIHVGYVLWTLSRLPR